MMVSSKSENITGGSPVMDIAYGADPRQQIDFYPPLLAPPYKLIVYLHGGGWRTGNRRGGRQLSRPMNDAGYALACVGYRLIPQTDLAGCISDVASAIAYLLRHGNTLHIDRRQCSLMGHSAGGHMAALLATDETHLIAAGVEPQCLKNIIALDGIFDIVTAAQDHAGVALRSVFGDSLAMWEQYSPVAHVGTMRGSPKFCLMYEDLNSRFALQAKSFETALKRSKKSVVSAVVPGLKHSELILLFKREDQPMLKFVMNHLAGTS